MNAPGDSTTTPPEAVRWDVDPVIVGPTTAWLGPSRRRAIIARAAATVLVCPIPFAALALVGEITGGLESIAEVILGIYGSLTAGILVSLAASRALGGLFAGTPRSRGNENGSAALLLVEREPRPLRSFVLSLAAWTIAAAAAVVPTLPYFVFLRYSTLVASVIVQFIAVGFWAARLTIAVVPVPSASLSRLNVLGYLEARIKNPLFRLRVGKTAYADPFGGYPRAFLALSTDAGARRTLVNAGVPDSSLPRPLSAVRQSATED